MTLDPQEIESVTVIKDIVGKAMYGPIGADGIIFIKTKRGRANERVLNVNAEYGVSVIDRFPEWVSGADYARLNNQARINDGLEPITVKLTLQHMRRMILMTCIIRALISGT